MAILRCNIITNEVGVKQYVPFALEDDKKATLINDGVIVFNVFPNGDKVDLRHNPPFVTIIPCPYCGTDNDRKHEPLKHIDPRLGTPNEPEQQTVQETKKEEPVIAEKTAPTQTQLLIGSRNDRIVFCNRHQLHYNSTKWSCPHCRVDANSLEKAFKERWDTSPWAADVLAYYKNKKNK